MVPERYDLHAFLISKDLWWAIRILHKLGERVVTKKKWLSLLGKLQIIPHNKKVIPVNVSSLDEFEKQWGVTLPRSYRAYCEVFGAGSIANEFNIAVPGYHGKNSTFSLGDLTNSQVELGDQYGSVGADAAQIKRSIFFSLDVAGSNHFFDPKGITISRSNEYAVYTLFRNYQVQRTAENFWQFISETCLGEGYGELMLTDKSPDQVFRPVS